MALADVIAANFNGSRAHSNQDAGFSALVTKNY